LEGGTIRKAINNLLGYPATHLELAEKRLKENSKKKEISTVGEGEGQKRQEKIRKKDNRGR